jgi:serine/threonine protein kinase
MTEQLPQLRMNIAVNSDVVSFVRDHRSPSIKRLELKMTNQSTYQFNSLLGCLVGDRDRYRLEVLLGKGGMGEVYKAIDTRLGKEVAIKLLKASLTSAATELTTAELDFKRRFERECAICAALKSENIVQVTDYGITSDGLPFYVMEYLEGQTLEQVLKHKSKLSIERAKDIMAQICAGLKSAHEGVVFKTPGINTDDRIKIIHRDLKPANIFLVPAALGERAKLIDFGVAKIKSLHAENPNLTNCFLGTHHYSAPEQFDGQEKVDERSDIYCLGLILYEMLTGVDPFGLKSQAKGLTGESWIKAHLIAAVQPIRSQPGCESVSVELERIVMRCLEKRPNLRFPSVEALAQALDAEKGTLHSRLEKFSNLQRNINQSLKLTSNQLQEKGKIKRIQWIVQFLQVYLFVNLFKNPTENKFSSKPLSCLSSDLRSPASTNLSIVNSTLIDRCKAELSAQIGPIASFIIEQTLSDTRYHQPQNFIEALAKRIPDANAAKKFRQALRS